MNPVVFRALVWWWLTDDPIADEQSCAVEVRCEAGADSCEARVLEACAMPLDSCLEAELGVRGRRVDVLGCASDARALVVDQAAVRAARKARP